MAVRCWRRVRNCAAVALPEEGMRVLLADWGPGAVLRRLVWLAAAVLFVAMLPKFYGWPKAASPLSGLAWDSHHFRAVPGIDFFAIYEAGVQWCHGRDPYMVDGTRIHEVGGPMHAPYVATYRYLPITTWWLAWPLGLLPPWRAWNLWTLALAGGVLWGALTTVGLASRHGHKPWSTTVLGAMWLAWFPTMVEWHMGQFSLFMALLMMLCVLPVVGKPWVADDGDAHRGLLLMPWALSVWLKQFSVVWWPWWLGAAWSRWRRSAGGGKPGSAMRCLALATCIPLAAAGSYVWWQVSEPESAARFRSMATDERMGSTVPYHLYWGRQGVGLAVAVTEALPSLVALPAGPQAPALVEYLHERHPAPWSRWITLGLSGLWGLVAVLAAFEAGRRGGPGTLEALALGWLWWFVVYVDCWEHHYTMLLPLLALLGATRSVPLWAVVVGWAAWGAPSLWLPISANWEALQGAPEVRAVAMWAYFAQRPVGVVLVGGLVLWRLWRLWWRDVKWKMARPDAGEGGAS